MANDFATIADLLADALDLTSFELDEIRNAAPVASLLPVIPSSNGDTHKYPVNTELPVTGFRSENAGRDFDSSVHRIETVTLKILDFSWAVDKAVADRWRQGGAAAYIAREGLMHLRSAMWKWEQQFFGGTTDADANGFGGLNDSTFLDALADDMVVNAGDSDVGAVSNAYLLRVGPTEVAAVMDGDGVNLGDTIVQNFVDGSNTNLPIYYTPGCTWTAAQLGAKYSAARIANLGDAANTLTDDLIYEAASLFPAGAGPTHLVCSQFQLEQLRASRTATNETGAPAPTPSGLAGIKIVTTDAITQAEAVLA